MRSFIAVLAAAASIQGSFAVPFENGQQAHTTIKTITRSGFPHHHPPPTGGFPHYHPSGGHPRPTGHPHRPGEPRGPWKRDDTIEDVRDGSAYPTGREGRHRPHHPHHPHHTKKPPHIPTPTAPTTSSQAPHIVRDDAKHPTTTHHHHPHHTPPHRKPTGVPGSGHAHPTGHHEGHHHSRKTSEHAKPTGGPQRPEKRDGNAHPTGHHHSHSKKPHPTGHPHHGGKPKVTTTTVTVLPTGTHKRTDEGVVFHEREVLQEMPRVVQEGN
ncbi:uncharacterized protein F4822DRAFT_351751 [Hypoxylon trugodes]|uniref:uncharacterized protein n=1 Tax=Hypoxylon trugodes TaxID=326681 RepID=UPI00219FF15C|nr:uncharacterized protein F4822DRAFT_351751 [Hypoxylon trugodes]KAI1385707.1 hypothetical protein F4822DRAFT_351751 [Hypoxylon trugodes]